MASEIILAGLSVIGLNGLVLKLQDNKINKKCSQELFEERTKHIAESLKDIKELIAGQQDKIDFLAERNGFKK